MEALPLAQLSKIPPNVAHPLCMAVDKTPPKTCYWAEPYELFWREYQPWACDQLKFTLDCWNWLYRVMLRRCLIIFFTEVLGLSCHWLQMWVVWCLVWSTARDLLHVRPQYWILAVLPACCMTQPMWMSVRLLVVTIWDIWRMCAPLPLW